MYGSIGGVCCAQAVPPKQELALPYGSNSMIKGTTHCMAPSNMWTCVAQAAPPKQELALPYGSYCMIKGDGSAPDRADKHPFCMSRVFYDASERPEELWAQLADGSCRWRQSGSEVKVVALRVRTRFSG